MLPKICSLHIVPIRTFTVLLNDGKGTNHKIQKDLKVSVHSVDEYDPGNSLLRNF